jgi:hypothetical protein
VAGPPAGAAVRSVRWREYWEGTTGGASDGDAAPVGAVDRERR